MREGNEFSHVGQHEGEEEEKDRTIYLPFFGNAYGNPPAERSGIPECPGHSSSIVAPALSCRNSRSSTPLPEGGISSGFRWRGH